MQSRFLDTNLSAGGGYLHQLSEAGLKTAEYGIVKGQFVAPGLHRLRLAAGLSGGLLSGRLLMNLLSGQHPDGSEVHADNVPAPLRPALGVMRFNNYSDRPSDRWQNAVDNVVPAVFGAAGVALASRWHFADRIKAAEIAEEAAYAGKKYFSHEDANLAISMRQAASMEKFTAAASTFGSSSGANLTPLGYGPFLSGLFALRADRKAFMGIKPGPAEASVLRRLGGRVQQLGDWFTGTKAVSPLGDEGNMRELWKHLLSHPEQGKAELHELENLGGGVLQGMLKHAKDDHTAPWLDELLAQRDQVIAELRGPGKLSADGKTRFKLGADGKVDLDPKLLNTVAGETWERLEQFGIRHGVIDMSSPTAVKDSLHIGNFGKLGETFEKASPKHRAHIEALREARSKQVYQKHHTYAKGLQVEGKLGEVGTELTHEEMRVARPTDLPNRKYQAIAAGGAATAAGLITYSAHQGDKDDNARKHGGHEHGDRLANAINGAPLSTVEWFSNALNFPPGLHRLENAAGLSAGMFGGMKIGEVLSGQTLGGKTVEKGSLFKPLQKLHGVMAYDFHGLDHGNRWMKVAHYALPAVGGYYGVKIGSDHFFEPQRERNHHAEFLDDYARKISYDQSRPWGNLSAMTALANVGTGAGFLPFGFGMSLGSRFLLGSDRKVVAPGLKEVWSNNHSKYPLGPASLRDRMINYMIYNPDKEPSQLNDMAKGILVPWFGEQPASVVQTFADDILKVRNQYYKDGGIPKADLKAAKKALQAHFVHQGLHDELAHLGLDVLNAQLDNNGMSGAIADRLGARKMVERDVSDFRRKELARRAEKKSPLVPVANDNAIDPKGNTPSQSERLAPVANDNYPAANENLTHSERVLQDRERMQGTTNTLV